MLLLVAAAELKGSHAASYVANVVADGWYVAVAAAVVVLGVLLSIAGIFLIVLLAKCRRLLSIKCNCCRCLLLFAASCCCCYCCCCCRLLVGGTITLMTPRYLLVWLLLL